MPRKPSLEHVKTVRVKGRAYSYFVTGQLTAKGKPLYVRLPDRSSPQWGAVYGSLCAARTKRGDIKPELSVPDLIALYRNSPKFDAIADNSRRIYNIYLKDFAAAYPTAPAGKIERQDVVRIVDKRAKTPGAANMLCRVIGALYRWGRQRGHVANDPTRDIEMLETGEHREWPEGLLTAALEAEDDRVRLAVHLLLYTAQRIGDVCKMRWTDIRDGEIEVRQQKTGKELRIKIHTALEAELCKHERSLGPILRVAHGRPMSAEHLRDAIQSFASARGHKIVPHGLRKNAVIALLEAGCSSAETAAISGQSLQLVEYYAKHRSQQKLGNAAILKWQGQKRNG